MTVLESCPGRGVEFDDLYQSGYPALVDAVETYDPASGAFSTWFMFYLKKAFADVTGYRTKSGRMEPLNNAISLDTPLTDDSDSDTMMEVTADPNGQRPTEDAEEAIFCRQLRQALEAALDSIPEEYSEVLRLRHYESRTLMEIAEVQGTTPERVRQKEKKALQRLRQPKTAACLRPFYDFDFYCHSGLSAFNRTGMSVQERYLVIEEDRRERAERRRQERSAMHFQEECRKEIQRIAEAAQARAESMTPEERARLLAKYGLA